MKKWIWVLVVIMFVGCNTEKRMVRHVLAAQAKYPEKTAAICAQLYPPLTIVKDSIAYKEGAATELKFIYIPVDSIYWARNNNQPNTKIIRQLRVDTVFIVKQKQVVNRAAVHSLQLALTDAQNKVSDLKHSNRYMLWAVIILGCYTLLRWVSYKLFKISLP